MIMHPSGLTLQRWNWPFKTETERKQIQEWLLGIPQDLLDTSNPF